MNRKDFLEGIRISYNKEAIREYIYNFSFREARRFHLFIYDALLKELYEDYCLVTAKHFECLVDKENKLLSDGTIRDRVSDEPQFLFGLYDKCKTAETVLRTNPIDGKKICTRLLLQCLYWSDNYREKYDWIVHELHDIIPKLSATLHENNKEDIEDESHCMLLYKSAQLLVKDNVPLSIELLRKAFEIAQGTTWTIVLGDPADGTTLVSMTKATAESLAASLLQNSYDIVQYDADQAIRNAQNALHILAKSNFGTTSGIFILTYLDLAYFFIENGRYEEAINSLEQIKHKLDSLTTDTDKYMLMFCKYYHFGGICYERLNKKDLAIRNHLGCIAIAREAMLEEYEARSLLQLAKIYASLGNVHSRMAEQCLNEAKVIFTKKKDYLTLKVCKFVQAKIQFLFVHPMLCDLIKRYPEYAGDRCRLLQWKLGCVTFWNNIYKVRELEEHDPTRFALYRRGQDPLLQPQRLNNFRRKLSGSKN